MSWLVRVPACALLLLRAAWYLWVKFIRKSSEQAPNTTEINAVPQTTFHVATVTLCIPQLNKYLEVLADLGAATSVMKHSSIGQAIKAGFMQPSRFLNLVATNDRSVGKIMGSAPVEISFTEDGPLFTHEVPVLDSKQVPDLWGVEFWDKYQANISFATKSIILHIDGESMVVPSFS